LKLGADLNARNKDRETPIFTTVDNDAIPLIIEHGADLTIRNNKGKTVIDTAKEKELFDKKLSARQFKVRTSVSSRLRGSEDPSTVNALRVDVNVAIRASRYLKKPARIFFSKNQFANHWALPIWVYSWL